MTLLEGDLGPGQGAEGAVSRCPRNAEQGPSCNTMQLIINWDNALEALSITLDKRRTLSRNVRDRCYSISKINILY